MILTGCILLSLRLQGSTPQFSTADNPSAKEPQLFTRLFTFLYLPVLNFWMLLYPNHLSFDWGMDAIPRIVTIRDYRNFWTVLFYATIVFIVRHKVNSLVKHSYHHIISQLKQKPPRDNTVVVANLNEDKGKCCPCSVCHQSFSDLHSASCRSTNNNNCLTVHTSCVCVGIQKLNFNERTYLKSDSAIFLLCIALLILPFIPATNLFFYVGFVVAERVLYLPSAGVCLLFGLCSSKLWESKKFRYAFCVGLLVLLVSFSTRTTLRNKDWKNEESLYRSAIPINPPKGEC